MRRILIACLAVAVIGGGLYGVRTWYVRTHCTMIAGREVCGADRYTPMLPAM